MDREIRGGRNKAGGGGGDCFSGEERTIPLDKIRNVIKIEYVPYGTI